MHPDTLGALVNGGLGFLGGVYVTLIGYRIIGKRLGESFEHDQWHERFGSMLKVFGPLMVALSIFLMARALVGGF